MILPFLVGRRTLAHGANQVMADHAWQTAPPVGRRQASMGSAYAPALVDIALGAHLADLDRGAILAVGRGDYMGYRLHRHLLRVRTVDQRLRDRPPVEAGQRGIAVDSEESKNRRRDVDIAHRRADHRGALEVDTPG